jgi:hypothetical protein
LTVSEFIHALAPSASDMDASRVAVQWSQEKHYVFTCAV